MKRRSFLALSAAGALTVLANAPAHAGRCDRGFAAIARAPHAATANRPGTYDTTRLARSRAIRYWKMKVRTLCPDHSAFWWRAFDKDVECEGYAGGMACRVEARPAHKFLR